MLKFRKINCGLTRNNKNSLYNIYYSFSEKSQLFDSFSYKIQIICFCDSCFSIPAAPSLIV